MATFCSASWRIFHPGRSAILFARTSPPILSDGVEPLQPVGLGAEDCRAPFRQNRNVAEGARDAIEYDPQRADLSSRGRIELHRSPLSRREAITTGQQKRCVGLSPEGNRARKYKGSRVVADDDCGIARQ